METTGPHKGVLRFPYEGIANNSELRTPVLISEISVIGGVRFGGSTAP